MYNNEFFQDITVDSNINGDNNYVNNDLDVDVNMMNYNQQMPNEQMNDGIQQRCIHRTFVHEVPQDCFFMIEK